MTLLVVSVVPVQARIPEFAPPPTVMVPFVPKALFEPVLPIFAALMVPLATVTAPLKLFAVLLSTSLEDPLFLVSVPAPLMTPDSVPTWFVTELTARLLVRTMLLEIVGFDKTLPVPPKINVGVVAPLLTNSRALPWIVSVGAVPEAGPTLVKLREFSRKFPLMSLFDIVLIPAACVAANDNVVSAALTGVALQFATVPPLQFVVLLAELL